MQGTKIVLVSGFPLSESRSSFSVHKNKPFPQPENKNGAADKANKNTWIFMFRSEALDRDRSIVLTGKFFGRAKLLFQNRKKYGKNVRNLTFFSKVLHILSLKRFFLKFPLFQILPKSSHLGLPSLIRVLTRYMPKSYERIELAQK